MQINEFVMGIRNNYVDPDDDDDKYIKDIGLNQSYSTVVIHRNP